jgi:uncharacterized membrane protein YvlD (DUF360 family)
MLRLALRFILTGALFCFVFPSLVPGIHFHGHFWPEGVVYAAVFAVTAWVVDVLLWLLIVFLALATFGIGLLLILPLRLLFFWLIPAIQLEVFAHWFPGHITIDSFGAAVLGGLCLMVANWVTMTPKKLDK